MRERECDVVLAGGRVIDPETGWDGIAHVGITGSQITDFATGQVPHARTIIDVSGRVVAPGWIDVHSHAQTVMGARLQARDGVTTALDLEGGVSNVAACYERASAEGRPIHFGFSASWQQARMIEVASFELPGELDHALAHFGDMQWQRSASKKLQHRLYSRLERDLEEGALGIGLLVGYAPGVDPQELLDVSRIAAQSQTATYTHARDLVEFKPDIVIDGAEEIVRAAQETGVQSHYCHIHSTSLWHVERVHNLLERAGTSISTEAYPYGAASTAISASFLAPERLAERRLHPRSILLTPSGRILQSVDELRELRRDDPGAIVVVHYLDEEVPADAEVLLRALTYPGAVVGSDAMPLGSRGSGQDPYEWPPPANTAVHPRNAGTFSRFIRRYVRELASFTLLDAVEKCTLLPAKMLESFTPVMASKGRVQVGCDADLVVFDFDRLTDRATYRRGAEPSTGYEYVFVAGEIVVKHDELIIDAFPGKPIRSRTA
ncbi:amidohydrolase family protein [Microbacterium sp. NIBRBAC000506063]|uniref:amidohydrolase family protein n=1 Tax=Microbacterium sp. NIBRBAC000506063 TaxID=2734618 RepID=UPI001BB652C6|nr:amidohydrolase family protein [Microbacterium sp. NIBRBAC000506063]QTV79584.1 amidohydrolase family protein [Microbacterium sp. NIBRBAC000506063]